jgi:hypothetical protein
MRLSCVTIRNAVPSYLDVCPTAQSERAPLAACSVISALFEAIVDGDDAPTNDRELRAQLNIAVS